MKKSFKLYCGIWFVLLAVFNIICFVIPDKAGEFSKFGGAFWVGYIFITLTFIGNLICAYLALKDDGAKKMFYNLPLIRIAYATLIAMLIVGAIVMALPNLPEWIGVIVCVLLLAFNIIAVLKATWAKDTTEKAEEKVAQKTAFIKLATVDAENLLGYAKNEEVKKACQKVQEALRYSDPMSSDSLSDVESEIHDKLIELSVYVKAEDTEKVKTLAEEIVSLVCERNNKCKALK